MAAEARPLDDVRSRASAARRRRMKQNLEGWLFISPIMLGVLMFYVVPILSSLYTSFTNADGFTPSRWVGTANYVRMFTRDQFFTDSLRNTFIYVFGHIPLTLGVALGLALLCNRPMRGVVFFRTAYFVPVITNVVAISLVWNYFFLPRIGPLNWFLGLLGIPGPGWLDSTFWAMPAVIIVSVWFGVGFPMVILLAGLQNIPELYYDAARVDGASAWARFRYITLPLLTPTLFFLTITQFISSFQVFGIIYVMTSGGPGNATAVYIYYLFQNAFQQSRMGYASAMAWVLFIVIATITIIQWKLQKKWVIYD